MPENSPVTCKAYSFPAMRLRGKNFIPVLFKAEQAVLNEPEPINLIHTIDVSSSMKIIDEDDEKKRNPLQIVKDNINELVEKLPPEIKKNIRHTLITFSDKAKFYGVFADEARFLKALNGIQAEYGTDFVAATTEILRVLRGLVKQGGRNLAVLFSDGDHIPRLHQTKHTIDKVYENIRKIQKTGTALFNVGVGEIYNRDFLSKLLQLAGFGGFAHIPVKKDEPDIYQTVVPKFIDGISKCRRYVKASFCNWFDYVVKLSPSPIQVETENVDDSVKDAIKGERHYQVAAGYQKTSYMVGFIPENDFFKANVTAMISNDPNSADDQEISNLKIVDIKDKSISEFERAEIKQLPFFAGQKIINDEGFLIHEVTEFGKDNTLGGDTLASYNELCGSLGINPKEMPEDINALATLADNVRSSIECNSDRASIDARASVDIDALTARNLQQESLSSEQTVIVDTDDYGTVDKRSPENSTDISEPVPVTDEEIMVAKLETGDKLFDLVCTDKNGEERIIQYRLNEEGANSIEIGKSDVCNIALENSLQVGEKHARIYMNTDEADTQNYREVFIEDCQGSIFHTKVDGATINEATKLENGSLIEIGDYKFTYVG